MMALLMKAPLLWTVLPVPWSAQGAAPALVSLAIGAAALWRLGPQRRSGSGATPTTDRSRTGSEARSAPNDDPRWR
jgi:hypothetical protein